MTNLIAFFTVVSAVAKTGWKFFTETYVPLWMAVGIALAPYIVKWFF